MSPWIRGFLRTLLPGRPVAPRGSALLALLLSMILTAPARAEWRSFGPDKGIRGGTISLIYEDRRQILWVGSNLGLERFDGVTSQPFPFTKIAPGRSVYRPAAAAEDSSRTLWIGTDNGIFKWLGGADSFVILTRESTGTNLLSNDVRSIFVDPEGMVWLGTAAGLNSYNPRTGVWQRFDSSTPAAELPSDVINSIAQGKNHRIWIGTVRGMCELDPGTGIGRQYTVASTGGGLPNDNVWAVAIDHEDRLWAVTDGGVARLDTKTGLWERFPARPAPDGPGTDAGNALLVDYLGNVWEGTSIGVSRFEARTGRWTSLDRTTSNGTLTGSQSIFTISQGPSHRVWIGGEQTSVVMYDGSDWSSYLATDAPGLGPSNDWINTIAVDSANTIWAGTVGGLSRFDGKHWTTISAPGRLPDDDVLSILPSRRSRKTFFGTTNGLSVLNWPDSSWTIYNAQNTSGRLPGNRINGLIQDSLGGIWACTDQGLGRFIPSSAGWTPYTVATSQDSLASDWVDGGTCTTDSVLWFVTRAGASSYDLGVASWHRYRGKGKLDDPSGPEGNQVFAALEGPNGELWFGTETGASLYDRRGNKWVSYGPSNTIGGLVPGGIRALALDDAGRIWFGSNRGASYFDHDRWVPYGNGSRLSDRNVFSIQRDLSGNLWFGTRAGVTQYVPDRIPPRTILSTPRAFPSSDVTLNLKSTLDEAARFSIRTDGVSTDEGGWSPWTTDRTIRVTGLAPGPHHIETRAQDEAGNIEQSGASADIEVDPNPPFPRIVRPGDFQIVHDTLLVYGSAEDARFSHYRLTLRSGIPPVESVLVNLGVTSVQDGPLATIDTRRFPDGPADLILSVSDTLGLTGKALTTIIIDNLPPSAQVTSPVLVSAIEGGDGYTSDGWLRLSISPKAFGRDDTLRMQPVDPSGSLGTPAPPPRELKRYQISWGSQRLAKAAGLAVAVPPESLKAGESVALYVAGEDGKWKQAIAGSKSSRAGSSTWISEPGIYALVAEGAQSGRGGRLLSAEVLPRAGVYRPGWAGFSIRFELSSADVVSISAYNRAGRMVAKLADRESRPGGRNVVNWDGRGQGNSALPDGPYVISIESSAKKVQKVIALASQ